MTAPAQLVVLLADDIRLELEIEKTFFQRSGFKVLTASDGPGALALAVAERPDLVILDQIMPGLSGSDVCRALKARTETREIPVVITSSSNSQEMESLCREAGAHSFVPKGGGREALLRTAARILRIPERRTARITVFFSVKGYVGGKESLGRGIDLSEGGLSLETSRRYEPGTTFDLRFLLPGERYEQNAAARVVRASERADKTYLLSLEFTAMSIEDRQRLNLSLDRSLSPRAIS